MRSLQPDPSKSPTPHRKSKSKSRPRREDDDGNAWDVMSDLSSICDCDHERKLTLALEDVKRLENELAQAKLRVQKLPTPGPVTSQPETTALLQTAHHELLRMKSAKEEVDRKLTTTTQALEKVLGQVQPLTTEVVRLKKDNDEMRKRLKELEGIKAKYLELATSTNESKDQSEERAAKAEEEKKEADTKVAEMKAKNTQLNEALIRAKEALGKSEAECKELREARVASNESQRENSGPGVDELQNQNDKLNAMLVLLKGQLSRATIMLREANGNLSRSSHLRTQAESQELKSANEKLEKEVTELKKKHQELCEALQVEKTDGQQENEAEKDEVVPPPAGDVVMGSTGQEEQANETSPASSSHSSDLSTSQPVPEPQSQPQTQPPSQTQTQSQPEPQAEPPIGPQPQPQPEPTPAPAPAVAEPQLQSSTDKGDGADPPPSSNLPLPTPPPETPEFSELQTLNSTLKTTVSNLQAVKSKLQTDVDALNEQLDTRSVLFRAQTNELIGLKAINAELKIKLDRVLGKTRAHSGTPAEDEVEGISAPGFGLLSVKDLRRKLKDAETEVDSLHSELRKLEKDKERWERQREKLEKDKERDVQKLREMKRSLDDLGGKYERAVRDKTGGGREPYSQYHTRHVGGRRMVDDDDDREERNSPYSSSSSTQVQAQARSSRHTSVELEEATKEIARLKDDLDYLQNQRDFISSRLKARDTEHAVFLQKDIVEHTNIHLLNRMVLQAKTDFASRRITRAQIVETCDTLSGQLLQIATRRLERLEGSDRVGFNGIMDLMDTASNASTSGPRWQGPIVNLGSASASGSVRRHDSIAGYGEDGGDSQEEDMTEPPPKRRKLPR
ncbi:hypothetical protein K435DRAFT_128044 [Dendrothele bispora CBS 962.96]|uniref:Uncharacterized protein n=1 Tax=Dendrothele bispora (strain CBS 962.96) TaxID=1314807 RepID=A0A4V4HFM2_DENBC|nr:hypothetical protein K435DRAFT_128044 [Dendrothele bispora CBS 962.96]